MKICSSYWLASDLAVWMTDQAGTFAKTVCSLLNHSTDLWLTALFPVLVSPIKFSGILLFEPEYHILPGKLLRGVYLR